jgi:hypothetical protein
MTISFTILPPELIVYILTLCDSTTLTTLSQIPYFKILYIDELHKLIKLQDQLTVTYWENLYKTQFTKLIRNEIGYNIRFLGLHQNSLPAIKITAINECNIFNKTLIKNMESMTPDAINILNYYKAIELKDADFSVYYDKSRLLLPAYIE